MAAAAIALTLISAATSIAGGVAAQKSAQAEAKQLRAVGEIEAEDRRRQTRRLLASQQVAFAGSGVVATTGTPLDVLGDTAAEEELAALRIQFGRENESAALRRRGDLAEIQGLTSGLGTVLGGAASFGNLGSKPSMRAT